MPVLTFMGGPDNNTTYTLSNNIRNTGIITLTGSDGSSSTIQLGAWTQDITIAASSWDTTNNTYTISGLTGFVTSASNQVILPRRTITQEQYEAFASAKVIGYSQSDGTLVLKALGDIPTIDVPITLMVLPF